MSSKRYFKNIKKRKTGNRKKDEFPSNSRSISDFAKTSTDAKALADKSSNKPARFKLSLPEINSAKLFKLYGEALKIFVIFIFITTAIIVGLDLQRNLQAKQSIDSQRTGIIKDLGFWKDFISKYQNYPDAYFQASILEYRLGNTSKAKIYAEKGLSLDPNSENGKKIEDILSK